MKKITIAALLLIAAQSHAKNYAEEDLKPKFDALPAGGRLEINVPSQYAREKSEFSIDNKTSYKVFLHVSYADAIDQQLVNIPSEAKSDTFFLPSNRGVKISYSYAPGGPSLRKAYSVYSIDGYIYLDGTTPTRFSNRYKRNPYNSGVYPENGSQWEVVMNAQGSADINQIK